MTQTPSDPLIGQTLDGRYLVQSRIARGGMAMVYRGIDTRLQRSVAIKVMHPHLAEDPDFRKRFEQEARNAAGLGHPNLVNVFDQGEQRGTVYLVMEYLPGITLRELLKQQRHLTTEQSLEISRGILSGLAAAHQSGIIHRDLKPENVLLADDGRIKLGDFGLARAASAHTTTGQALLGTIAYLSPELITRGVADARSDIYAFGIMLFEMLTGVQPFRGEQPMQIAYQHAHDPVPVPSSLSAESTPALDEIVRWSTLKDPEERPAHAGELLTRLHALTAADTGTADDTHVLATRALTAQTLAVDPETTVLPQGTPQATAPDPAPRPTPLPAQSNAPVSHAGRAQSRERVRKRRGVVLLVITLVLAASASGIGVWFGHGPGSLIPVPQVLGAPVAEAEAALTELELRVSVDQCSHLTVPVGHVTDMVPSPGTRVKRDSTVTLCESTGPAILPTPDLVGKALGSAHVAITDAGFVDGGVIEERFDEASPGTVLAALTADGEILGETAPEQSTITLIVSAGAVPSVAGMSLSEATSRLADAGLVVDDTLRSEAHSETVPKDHVLDVFFVTDPVRTGDSVGLNVSLGPELFEIPSVENMSVQEAIDSLTAAGFVPKAPWFLRSDIYDSVNATGTSPAAGEFRARGTTVDVRASIFN